MLVLIENMICTKASPIDCEVTFHLIVCEIAQIPEAAYENFLIEKTEFKIKPSTVTNSALVTVSEKFSVPYSKEEADVLFQRIFLMYCSVKDTYTNDYQTFTGDCRVTFPNGSNFLVFPSISKHVYDVETVSSMRYGLPRYLASKSNYEYALFTFIEYPAGRDLYVCRHEEHLSEEVFYANILKQLWGFYSNPANSGTI